MTAGAAGRPAGGATGSAGVTSADAAGNNKPVKAPASALPPGAPPAEPPPFSVADIRRAIPEHLFERSAFWGFVHLFRDLALVAALVAANAAVQGAAGVPAAVKLAVWPVYWYLAGCYLTGVWVVAHECGHQAFSSSRLLNDTVGFVLHSALLVPYFPWAISHAHHHANTCSMEDDEVFVPATRSDFGVGDALAESPVAALLGIARMLLVGWPGYLLANFTGPAKYRGKDNSHFSPASALFTSRQAPYVALSTAGVLAALGALAAAGHAWGAAAVTAWYGVPYLVVNAHLVLITYLQHTGPAVPHYRAPQFTWLRGALSTVDRSYGALLDDAFHHIADSHVVHHLFHTMPWYNAVAATPHVKRVLGRYYLSDDTAVPVALWRMSAACKFVEDDGDIVFYKDAAGFDAGTQKKAA